MERFPCRIGREKLTRGWQRRFHSLLTIDPLDIHSGPDGGSAQPTSFPSFALVQATLGAEARADLQATLGAQAPVQVSKSLWAYCSQPQVSTRARACASFLANAGFQTGVPCTRALLG